MKLLDIFCGAGGAAVGYHRAGFEEIFGVDIVPQKRYPFRFIQGDALIYLAEFGSRFDFIHASPPCQLFSIATYSRGRAGKAHQDLLTPTIDLLNKSGRPWIVENVYGSPLPPPAVMLCGLMFGLKVFRHRWFASSMMLLGPSHPSHRGKRLGVNGMCCLAGHGGQSSGFGNYSVRVPADHRTKDAWSRAIGIDWMSRKELAQAVPPAYTEHLGMQVLAQLGVDVPSGNVTM